jgi:hypothetical protein
MKIKTDVYASVCNLPADRWYAVAYYEVWGCNDFILAEAYGPSAKAARSRLEASLRTLNRKLGDLLDSRE